MDNTVLMEQRVIDTRYDETGDVIISQIYPIVEKALSNGGTVKLKNCIGRFISARSKAIHDSGPNDRIYFGKADNDDFFNSIGIKESDIIAALKNTYYWNLNFSPKAAKDPFTVTMIMVIRYLYMHKMKKDLELACIYLTFSGMFYASVHSGAFPNFAPGEHRSVMDYVVNYKLTQKFDLKKEGSVFGAVRVLSETWINSYGDKLKNPDDSDVAYVIQQLRDRLKSFMKNIAKSYYDAYKNKEYLNYESDNITDSGDGYRLTDSNSLLASRFTENTVNYFSTTSVNYAFCKMCSDTNVKTDEIRDIINSIIHNSIYMGQIREVVNILVTDYMRMYPDNQNVGSISFLSYTIKAKPNTKDDNLLTAKKTIESWLDETSPNYRRRKTREATKNSYYKAIMQYIALAINKANK